VCQAFVKSASGAVAIACNGPLRACKGRVRVIALDRA